MPKIVQFTHPGNEHKPDKKDKHHKSWNKGNHMRKFINASGDYVVDGELKSDDLIFWGEWEPPSTVTALDNKSSKLMPNWLHKPYLPEEIPISDGYQQSYQNTDPLVFGEQFRYFVCKQFQPKRKKETSSAKLDKGSVILFGSTADQNTSDAFFQLDTVFVVSDYIEYDPSKPEPLGDYNKDNYKEIVFKMAFPDPLDYSLKLRLYFGATYDNPVSGMYSYSPAKVYTNEGYGFPRIGIKDIEYITNNLNAAPKYSEVSINDIVSFWGKIRSISRKKGCVEGVKFNI